MSTASKPALSATPAAVAEVVAYQPGAVVSREVMKRPTGSVTAFAFDAGQGLSEHTAPFDAMVQVLDGQARVTIGGNTVNVAAGQAVIMPANVPHALHAEQPFKMLLIMLRS